MKSESYNIIRAAMLARRQVVCSYNGYRREICVHTIGMSGGKEMILGYQFAGESSNPPQSDEQRWRCMEVAKLERITVRDGPWRTSTNHSKAQTCVKDVDLEITS
jgi:hypothetical protein